MRHSRSNTAQRLMCGAAAIAILSCAGMAHAEEQRAFTIEPQSLSTALAEFGAQSGHPVMAPMDLLGTKTTRGFSDSAEPTIALAQLLDGTGLTFTRSGDTFAIVRASDPQSGSAAGDGADNGTVQALIVTAQKREEDIQDVPIAISAFTQEDLTRSQVAGGPDLVTQIPNFTFTKTNFSGYSIQIRGIGTQAISATTDPAVAVAFNNTPFIRNRFFEQEFYDLERVEVLRGPQGTLYGRNATGGVVNIISAKPKFRYEARLSADLGNYSSSRVEGMVNIPLVEDKVALRLAGAWTKRDGYATNQITGNPIDGRDLWSTRVSLRIQPSDRLNANLIWEHFQEDDDRLRSGKQLCKKDIVTDVGTYHYTTYPGFLTDAGGSSIISTPQSLFSQGCKPVSLYSPEAFQTPNGQSIPYYFQLQPLGLPAVLQDPYVSSVQSPDLRVIESTVDPKYRAKTDLGELQISFDLTDSLSLSSETAFSADQVFSLQDFNRFNTAPGAWIQPEEYPAAFNTSIRQGLLQHGPNGGIFCDPQVGCSDRLVAIDISTAKSHQFSQELRLASDFQGPFNFSIGANFLRADSEDKYYVFINSLTLVSAIGTVNIASGVPYVAGQSDNLQCMQNGYETGNPNIPYQVAACVYIDPNPIGNLNDQGHNYFLSKNPYKLISYAVFGEAYYNIAQNLKLTAGLRWTVDKKEAPRIPSWLLASGSVGYPVANVIDQEWREPTGRLTLDWKPGLSFTDQTLIYAALAHGYKAGGANPPGYVRVFYGGDTNTPGAEARADAAYSATRPQTFAPEFINAYEVGTKNTLDDGKVTLNLTGFYYDYTGYQVSEIVDRSAFNRNFDATVWGVELESEWRPLENLKAGLKIGYLDTRIANGEKAVDLMDRTAGVAGWSVVRPFPTYASNCILPTWLYQPTNNGGLPFGLGNPSGGGPGGCELAYRLHVDPVTEQPYAPYPPGSQASLGTWLPGTYPGFDPLAGTSGDPYTGQNTYNGIDYGPVPNNGEGFDKQLGGNQLPNSPHWTATTTLDYTAPLANNWLMTLHSDVHWQSQSWWRVFNDKTFDKLHPYFTMNLAAIFTNEDAGWTIMAYIKNVTDETAITGAFLNSDDTGLTTNVFLTEPRLYGLRVTKAWTGGSLLGNFGARRNGSYPFTIEIGGQVQRYDAPNEVLFPSMAANFHAPLDIFDDAQNAGLDWGDGREAKLTWRPSSDSWSVTASYRWGQANGYARPSIQHSTDPVCIAGGFLSFFCASTDPTLDFIVHYKKNNQADAFVGDGESYELADLSIGHGISLVGDSTVSLGLRHASFDSTTQAELRGVPDWDIAEGAYDFAGGTPVTHTVYDIHTAARRKFAGVGPVLSWDASMPLARWNGDGELKADWSVSGGVLFGDQNTSVSATQESNYYAWSGIAIVFPSGNTLPSTTTVAPPENYKRSAHATVPTAGASLGLSYNIDGFKLGAGYRWERYFNAIDGGYEEHKSYDRTFDGPYFKIAVGFGG